MRVQELIFYIYYLLIFLYLYIFLYIFINSCKLLHIRNSLKLIYTFVYKSILTRIFSVSLLKTVKFLLLLNYKKLVIINKYDVSDKRDLLFEIISTNESIELLDSDNEDYVNTYRESNVESLQGIYLYYIIYLYNM